MRYKLYLNIYKLIMITYNNAINIFNKIYLKLYKNIFKNIIYNYNSNNNICNI